MIVTATVRLVKINNFVLQRSTWHWIQQFIWMTKNTLFISFIFCLYFGPLDPDTTLLIRIQTKNVKTQYEIVVRPSTYTITYLLCFVIQVLWRNAASRAIQRVVYFSRIWEVIWSCHDAMGQRSSEATQEKGRTSWWSGVTLQHESLPDGPRSQHVLGLSSTQLYSPPSGSRRHLPKV